MVGKADAARFIAKLLANRQTPLQEVPQIIASVDRAFSILDGGGNETATPQPRRMDVTRGHAKASRASQRETAAVDPPQQAAQPTLLRRAEVVAAASALSASVVAPSPTTSVRGVVQWFDSRNGRGTLRLPGLSRDLPIDSETVSGFGISRLFKGQEIEATLESAGDTHKILALHLTNAPATSPVTGGTVHDRRAKPVVVELKREAQRRSTARAEAELLLPPRRAR